MKSQSSLNKPFTNPYRIGVKIGNYSKDIYGKELTLKYLSQQPDKRMYISEQRDRFIWPKPSITQVSVAGNDITKPHTSNYNLNLVMANDDSKKFQLFQTENNTDNSNRYGIGYDLDYRNGNGYLLEDKNKFLPNEITAEDKLRRLSSNSIDKSLHRETQNILNKYHIKDTSGIFNTKTEGIANHLLFGHSKNQNSFRKNEYSSTYDLTMNQKERTELIFNPRYQVKQPQHIVNNKRYDNSNWGFRKYKQYDQFTQSFDRSVNNLKRKYS